MVMKSGDKVVMVLYLKVGSDEKSGDKVVMELKLKNPTLALLSPKSPQKRDKSTPYFREAQ